MSVVVVAEHFVSKVEETDHQNDVFQKEKIPQTTKNTM
jgi:hypothetical protein